MRDDSVTTPGRSVRGSFGLAFSLLVAAHVVLVLSCRLYPFVDLPNHLAVAAIYRGYDDPATLFSEYYALDQGVRPNQAHRFFCALPAWPSVETANRWFLALYVIALPVAVLLVVRRFGGDPWYALLSLTLLYNYNLRWGFMNFVGGIPLILLFWLVLSLEPARRSWGRGLAAAVLLVALFAAHALLALFGLLLLFVSAFALPVGGRRSISACALPAAPALVLIGLWWSTDPAGRDADTLGFLADYYRAEYAASLPDRLGLLYYDNEHLLPGWMGTEIGLLFGLAIVFPLVLWLILRRKQRKEGRRVATMPPLVWVPAACAFACFILLPAGLPEQKFLYERFAVLTLIAAIVVASVAGPLRTPRWVRCLFGVIALAHLVLYAGYFRGFQRENDGFEKRFLAAAPADVPLAGLIYDREFRGTPVYIHFPNYQVVWNRGVAVSCIVDYRFGTVRRKASEERLPVYTEWISPRGESIGPYRDVGSLLVRGTVPEVSAEEIRRFTRAAAAGPWALYLRREENSGRNVSNAP